MEQTNSYAGDYLVVVDGDVTIMYELDPIVITLPTL